MRKSLLAAAVITVATATTTFAADAVVPPAPTADDAAVEDVVRGQSGSDTVVRSQSRRGGFFARIREMEQRKNAWLRRTFLNR